MKQLRDLAKTVFSLLPRSPEAAKCLEIPLNQSSITYELIEAPKRNERGATPHLTPPKIKLTIGTDKFPRHPTRGWIFGSNPEQCDYLLDTSKERGVSGSHFEVHYNWENAILMIQNLSSNELLIQRDNEIDVVIQGDKRALCYAICSIEIGFLVFDLEIPDRGQLQSLYEDNLQTFRGILKGATPNLASLVINRSSQITPIVKGSLAEAATNTTSQYHPRWKIGSGSTGVVYNGIDRFSGREVALKEFRDRTTELTISSEMKILRRLAHVHITRYIDFIEKPSRSLVMEFVGGGSLADLQDISRSEIILLSRQTSQALSYLHDQNITHRDVKPANVLIVSRGRQFYCKLADFGESSDDLILNTFYGTAIYQAPEITDPPYSESVDVWSLGVVLVELWYDCFASCLHGLTNTLPDSWLADTQGKSVPGIFTFQKNKFKTLHWTASRMSAWHDYLHRKLQVQGIDEHDPMAQILLQMLEKDPHRRCSANHCRYHFDKFPLPAEDEQQDNFHLLIQKRHAKQAGLDDLDLSRRIQSRLSESSGISAAASLQTAQKPPQLVTLNMILEEPDQSTVRSLSASQVDFYPIASQKKSEETSEAAIFLDQSQNSEVCLSDYTVVQPRRSARLNKAPAISPCQEEQVIRLNPDSREINGTDILRATGRKRPRQEISKYIRRVTRTGTYMCYEDGRAFIRYLNMSEDSTSTLFMAMDQGLLQVKVPITGTTIAESRLKHVGSIVHLDPAQS